MAQPSLFERPMPSVPEFGRAGVRFLERSQVLTRPTGRLAAFDYSLNPYVGCGFGCSYCYASFFQPDPERFETWGKWVDVKRNAAEAVRSARNLKGKRVMMSSATDPYQPIESVIELTREILEALSEPDRQPRLYVQTRSPLVTRDLDILRRFEDVRVNMSVTTDSERVRKAFEPACASIERRLQAVAEVRRAGIPANVWVSPMLPIENPARFARRILETGASGVSTSWFHFSDRPFASSTRPEAVRLLEEWKWNEAEHRKAAAELRRHLGGLLR